MENNNELKIPVSDMEAIIYGYGKAIEKLNNQSDVIKRQGREIQRLKRQVEEERKERERRLKEQWLIKTGTVREWYEHLDLPTLATLQDVYSKYVKFCNDNDISKVEYRAFGIELRNLGCIFIRKRDGMWVMKP